jgi:hypothetical protein
VDQARILKAPRFARPACSACDPRVRSTNAGLSQRAATIHLGTSTRRLRLSIVANQFWWRPRWAARRWRASGGLRYRVCECHGSRDGRCRGLFTASRLRRHHQFPRPGRLAWRPGIGDLVVQPAGRCPEAWSAPGRAFLSTRRPHRIHLLDEGLDENPAIDRVIKALEDDGTLGPCACA